MFRGLVNKKRRPIGIDFGAHSIRMLQLAPAPGGYAAVAAACRALPADLPAQGDERVELLAPLILDMLADSGASGREVVCCLPATSIQYKNLRLPKMPADELPAAVAWEAADRLKLDPDTTRFQYFDAGEVRQGSELRQEIILLAAPVATVDEYVQVLLSCDLRPQCIEAVPSALARSSGSRPTDAADEAVHVILDVGLATSKVLIVRRGRVVFFKLIDNAGRTFDQRVAQQLRLPLSEAAQLRRRLWPEESDVAEDQALFGSAGRESVDCAVSEALRAPIDELSKELGLCLRYFSVTFRGRRPEAVKLAGGEARGPQLAKLLADGVGIQTEPVSLAELVDFAPAGPALAAPGAHSAWAVAAGLALWRPARVDRRSAA